MELYIRTVLPPRLLLPLAPGRVPAGFPSPADDVSYRRVDLNDLLVTHPQATFLWRASGQSMAPSGIGDGDLLVVNRAIRPVHGHIVIAQIDGDFTVKHLVRRGERFRLVPGNPTYPEIVPRPEQTVVFAGVVVASIRRFVTSSRG